MTKIFKGTKWSKAPNNPTSPTSWDAGASGPANQDRLRMEPATDFDPETGREQPNPNGVKRHRRETWVDKYARKGKLTPAQQAAAQNLYAAWAGYPSKDPIAALSGKVDSSGNDPMVKMIDGKRAFFAMWAQVPDGSKPFLRHVVIEDLSIRSIAGCKGSRAEERYMMRLREGLDAIS